MKTMEQKIKRAKKISSIIMICAFMLMAAFVISAMVLAGLWFECKEIDKLALSALYGNLGMSVMIVTLAFNPSDKDIEEWYEKREKKCEKES